MGLGSFESRSLAVYIGPVYMYITGTVERMEL